MPSSVFGGKNSNEKHGRVSSRISSIRIEERLRPIALHTFPWRDDVEVGRDPVLAPDAVLHVDRVVLAVGAEQAEEDRRPAGHAELALLLQVAAEDERTTLQRVVLSLRLRNPVHEDAVRRLGLSRQRHDPALLAHGASSRRSASYGDSPPCCTTRLRRTRPVNASDEPSPRTSTPARIRGPFSSSRAATCCTGS